MSWGRIDDRLDDSPKFSGISPDAAGLWLLCLPRALRADDGLIPPHHPARFMSSARASRYVAELVERRLWDVKPDGGWSYHAFDEYRAPVSSHEQHSAAGKASARARRERFGSAVPIGAPNVVRTERTSNAPNPEPVPEPVPGVAKATTPKPPTGVPNAVHAFTSVWNAHCEPLPKLRKPPPGIPAQRLMVGAIEYLDGDLTLLGSAVERCATDPHYREQRYGFEAFCRHLPARWAEAPRPRVVSREDGYADAARFGPSALSAAYQAMDRAHTDEEKMTARTAILAAQAAAGMVAHA